MTNEEKNTLAKEIIEEKLKNQKNKTLIFNHPTNFPKRQSRTESRKKRLDVHKNNSFANLLGSLSMSSVGGFRNKKTKKAKYSRRSKKIKQYKN